MSYNFVLKPNFMQSINCIPRLVSFRHHFWRDRSIVLVKKVRESNQIVVAENFPVFTCFSCLLRILLLQNNSFFYLKLILYTNYYNCASFLKTKMHFLDNLVKK